MSSYRRSSCRRRQWSIGVGAVLVGAVIPIAAAASAWADGLTETEDFGQLVGQGLNYYEAYEVAQAESTGLPVEVSYDGQVVVEANEPTDPLLGAFAESGTGSDVAAAIATNSPAIENQTIADALLGSNNVAFADGGGSFAIAGNEVPTTISNNDTATAIGTYSFAYATSGSNNSATDIGSNSFADSTGNHDIVYDVGSGIGNGANDVTAGGDIDFVIGFGNGLPNTDIVNTGVFDIVTPQSGDNFLSAASAAETSPANFLSDATANLTDATQVLTALPTVGDASTAGLLTQQTLDLQDIAQLGTSESALSTYDNGALAELLNPLFNSVNQGWDQASEAVLTADQALQVAAGIGSDTSIDSAIYGLLGAQLESPVFSSDFIDLAAHFLTGIDPFSAGVDTASAIDPGIVADVLSSIGL
jgi:hypothetical protein